MAGICISEHTEAAAGTEAHQTAIGHHMVNDCPNLLDCIKIKIDAVCREPTGKCSFHSLDPLLNILQSAWSAVTAVYGFLDRNEMGGIKYGWALLVAGYSVESPWLS